MTAQRVAFKHRYEGTAVFYISRFKRSLAKVTKARTAADLLPISERRRSVTLASLPRPSLPVELATTLLLLPLLLYLPSPTVSPFFLHLPWRRGFFSRLSHRQKRQFSTLPSLHCSAINWLLKNYWTCKENFAMRKLERFLLLDFFLFWCKKFSKIWEEDLENIIKFIFFVFFQF